MPQPRSHPVPPSGSGSQPLSAVEEKARLKAMYDAEDRKANGFPAPIPYSQVSPILYSNGVSRQPSNASNTFSLSSPPPLAPRPPREYIQETQEEDARLDSRLRAIDQGQGENGSSSVDTHHSQTLSQSLSHSGSSHVGVGHIGVGVVHKLPPFAPDSLNRSESDLRPPLPSKQLYID